MLIALPGATLLLYWSLSLLACLSFQQISLPLSGPRNKSRW